MELLLLYPDGSGEIKRLGNDVTQVIRPSYWCLPVLGWGASPVGAGRCIYLWRQ